MIFGCRLSDLTEFNADTLCSNIIKLTHAQSTLEFKFLP